MAHPIHPTTISRKPEDVQTLPANADCTAASFLALVAVGVAATLLTLADLGAV